MRPGIVVQYSALPSRRSELVRCDVTGIIGFISRHRWPPGASAGDFIELVLRREEDLWAHPDRHLFDRHARRAARDFFRNGGDVAHLFGVCVGSMEDLASPAGADEVLGPLLERLREEEDIALLLVPAAAVLPCEYDRRTGGIRAAAEVLYDALLAHCREMTNRFLVMDPPRGLHEELLVRWVRAYRRRDPVSRSYGALYYPWLCEGDEAFPPSGAVAGCFARVELEHRPTGVGWPPANVVVAGVTHPELEMDWQEAGELAEEGINPIVVQAGRGVVVFGARTLSDDPVFRFVNARRIVNMVAEQLRRDTQWAVFETNNPHLWDVLERDVRLRLQEFVAAGLLLGTNEDGSEAVEARCDAETNLPALRDAGQVNLHVRMRPVGTVEHVEIDLRIDGESYVGGA